MFKAGPVFSIHCECYHFETHTVTVRVNPPKKVEGVVEVRNLVKKVEEVQEGKLVEKLAIQKGEAIAMLLDIEQKQLLKK
jgi:hypothetical protein